MYADLLHTETARAEDESISSFSNEASGIDASGYLYRGVDENENETLAFYGFEMTKGWGRKTAAPDSFLL